MKNIRNFCIIAHIDHGKSTLADRLIQKTLKIPDREFRNQMLDTMDLERERGITIKSQTVCLPYKAQNGEEMIFNLIDTPGHVDFSYEVSRSLASCEGALLLVDASQGVEAQTVANLYMAMEHDLEIIPVINKIDLPAADIDMCNEQIENELGLDPLDALHTSAKTGAGIDEALEAIAQRIPSPKGDPNAPLQALIFDSLYDPYRGVIVYVRVFNGTLKTGDQVKLMSTNAVYKIEELGVMQLKQVPRQSLSAGEVGYIITGMKTISEARVGDTVTHETGGCAEMLAGFKEVKPVVFSSIYPLSTDDFPELADSMERLKLNDASLVYTRDSSSVLGQGFRCGFLGLLHLEITEERLEREYDQSIILTAPSVEYRVYMRNGECIEVDNPIKYPDPSNIDYAEEPYIIASFMVPKEFVGAVINLCISRRGIQVNMGYIDSRRVELKFELPLSEILFDFYDKLKTVSKGYASFDYDFLEYRRTKLVKLSILVNHEPVDALSVLVHEERAVERARIICKRLSETIARHQFKIPIQGAIGGNIIARETVNPVRKDVLAKCYGGDITRKRKLLEKQKAGKKRMMQIGEVEIPQKAFLAVLKNDEDDD
ncbi:MAG: translation elongation factor 4 [Proteobacteria bacterium]|nr:translation elongation factor 4 [Pseudomonadota bacterium]MBQ4360687.1 translation elongation factor 4 [Pseudomonadota bacterium]